ncbi:MAG TPA: ATP-binding protein, partial [Dehalococcoidia bacterium]|nr:ATP-binding protein [Dehalococcoidia bacterium]
ADSGPGINQDALQHLFDAFYRAPGQGPKVSGSGLGLAVAKGLVEAHGGSIRAENRPEGGARFVFELPVEEEVPEPEEVAS